MRNIQLRARSKIRMKHIHRQEKEQFKKLFIKENIDNFEDRFKVLEGFLQTEKHLTSDELLSLINEDKKRFTKTFVSDTLNLMCVYGFARANRFQNGSIRYEHRHIGQHHDHMICTKCKKIIEFHNKFLENLQIEIAASNSFHMLRHKMEIYGICSECLQERSDLIPMAKAKQGEVVKIKDFTGGPGFAARMLSMGLRLGESIKVITNHGEGQIVFAIENSRFAVGRKVGYKILVKPEI